MQGTAYSQSEPPTVRHRNAARDTIRTPPRKPQGYCLIGPPFLTCGNPSAIHLGIGLSIR
jgi:hypothetical protein